MPWAAIAAIASIAASGVGIGETISNSGGPSAPPPSPITPTPATTTTAAGPSSEALKALISQPANNIVSQTSGLANPDYISQLAQVFSGTSGQTGSNSAAQSVVSSLFGGNQTPSFSPSGINSFNAPAGPVNLSDYLTSLSGNPG